MLWGARKRLIWAKIARNLSFAAAWIASKRPREKTPYFAKISCFLAGHFPKQRNLWEVTRPSGHALYLPMGLRDSSWGWDCPSNLGIWGYVEARFTSHGYVIVLFQPMVPQACQGQPRPFSNHCPKKTSPEPAGTLPEPRLRCLRADFLGGC